MAALKCCPTCKQPLPPEIRVPGKRRQLLLDYVLRHPEGVTNAQIMSYVWNDDPNGGPQYNNVVSVMVHAINGLLEKSDAKVRIRGSGGPGSIYRAVYRI